MLDDLNKGIVLDYDLSMVFKAFAYKEGFLSNNGKKLSQAGESFFSFDTYKTFKDLACAVYSSIVIFDKIHVQTKHNIRENLSELYINGITDESEFLDYDELIKEEIVNLIQYKPTYSISRSKIYRPLRYSDHEFEKIKPVDFELKKEILIQYVKSRALVLRRKPYNNNTYERAFALLLEGINENWQFEVDSPGDISMFVAVSKNPRLEPVFNELYLGYKRLRHVINETNRLHCPGKSLMPKFEKAPVFNSEISRAAFRIYEIILEEEFSFPYPRTLKAAIKLRKDKRIIDFRENLFYWSNSLVTEGALVEARFRKEVVKAGRELKKLSTYKKIGRIITFAALPVAIISALTQFPLGLFVIPISQAIALNTIEQEKKHSWLLFGK